MKHFCLFALFFFGIASAQNQIFTYEYSFVKDSLDRSKVDKEMMYLEILPKGSKFYSAVTAKSDSILAARAKIGDRNSSDIQIGKIYSVIEKEYPTMKIFDYEPLGTSQVYRFEEMRRPVWKILPEKSVIANLPVQKATTNLYGRNWTAWFATDIPISDGPYKFAGLPGLILQIEDASKSHHFELTAIQKLPENYAWTSINEKKTFRSIINLDAKQYKKAFIENRENPSKEIRQLMAQSNMKIVMQDEKGQTMDIETFLRDQDRNAKENNKHDNNPLDLELIK